jgi:hypothetical protein
MRSSQYLRKSPYPPGTASSRRIALRALPVIALVVLIAAIAPIVGRAVFRRLRVMGRRARRTVARPPRSLPDGSIVDLAGYRGRQEAHVRLVPRAAGEASRPGITVAPPAGPARSGSIKHLA